MKAYRTSRNAAVAAAVAIGVAAAAAGQTASAEAAALISEVPFQLHLVLTCNTNNTSCFRSIAPVPAKERLVIQFVSCTGDGAFDVNARLRNFSLTVTAGTRVLGHHYIAPTYRSAELPFVYVASQPMLLTALAGNVLSVGAVSTGGIFNVACGLSGVKQKFQ
jgi:hypothetical protein